MRHTRLRLAFRKRDEDFISAADAAEDYTKEERDAAEYYSRARVYKDRYYPKEYRRRVGEQGIFSGSRKIERGGDGDGDDCAYDRGRSPSHCEHIAVYAFCSRLKGYEEIIEVGEFERCDDDLC